MAWLTLAAGLAAVVFVRPPMLALVTNSDALLPADLVWEFLNQHQDWRSFQWPRIPSLVPDLLVYGALQAGFGWRWAQLGYSMLSLVALGALAGLIGARLAPIGFLRAAATFLGATACVLLAEWGTSSTAWHLHLLAAAFHSGPFILSVAALYLAMRRTTASLAGMTIIAAAATFSDKMLVGIFLVPLIAALVWECRQGTVPRQAAWRVGGLAFLGCAAGAVADRLVFPSLLARQADLGMSPYTAMHNAIYLPLDRSFWFVLVLNLSLLVPLWRGWPARENRIWWIAAATAALLSSMLAAGLWLDDGGQRYLSAALWWPLILIAPAFALRIGRIATPLALAATAAVVATFASGAETRHPLLSWQDPLSACIASTGLHAGLAEYWQARRITVSADWRLRVVQIGPTGDSRIWGNDPVWFTKSDITPGALPDFRFIVMDGLNTAAIRTAYGPPDQTLPCPGSDVWLYNDAAHVRDRLQAASPGLVPRGQEICIDATRLSRRGGPLPAGPLAISDDRRTSRPVTWGPNIDLPAGHWRVALRYRLSTDHPGGDRWLINGQYGTNTIATATLPPAGPEGATVSREISLDREVNAVEIPTYFAGRATFEILEARFTPLDGAVTPCSGSQGAGEH